MPPPGGTSPDGTSSSPSAAVVNDHPVAVSGLPAASVIAEDSEAMYSESKARFSDGVNVAVFD